MRLPTIILICPQGPVPPIVIKLLYWGLGHIERAIRTNLNISVCISTVNNTTKNYPHRSTGSGTSHSSQIGVLGSWAHRTSDLHQI